MNIQRKKVIKDADSYYVVTREGRRIEENNYKTKREAQWRARTLRAMLKKVSPRDANTVGIVYTSRPRSIY